MTHVLEVRRKARIELEDRRQLQSELEKWQTPSELETSKKSHLTPPPPSEKQIISLRPFPAMASTT